MAKELGVAKAAQYKEHKERYKRAIRAECYLECIFIDYAMMEDRLMSILHHLGIANRERGERGGWAKSPIPRRDGYKSALCGMIKMQKNGALPKLENISVKIDVLKALAELGEVDGCRNDFEQWLRTDVRCRLSECGTIGLCESIKAWVKQRNDLIHALFGSRSRDFDSVALQALAVEGMNLAVRLDKISGYSKTLMKHYEKKRVRRARARGKKAK